MNSATLFVVLWLANGGQQTVLKLDHPNIAECKDAAATMWQDIWRADRWHKPGVKSFGVYCGYPDTLSIAR